MDWNIQRSNRQCSSCSRQFAEGEFYYSALFDSGEEFAREDFCLECWEGSGAEQSAFSFWKTHVAPRAEQKKLFVDDDVLLDFFLRLSDEESEQPDHKVKFRYILALVLMRKKLLRFVDILREGQQEIMLLRYPRADRNFRVIDPGLTEEEADTVKEDLSQVLNIEM